MPYQLSSVEFGQSAQTFSNLRECDMTRRPFFSMQIFLLPNNWCSITRFFYTEGSTWFHISDISPVFFTESLMFAGCFSVSPLVPLAPPMIQGDHSPGFAPLPELPPREWQWKIVFVEGKVAQKDWWKLWVYLWVGAKNRQLMDFLQLRLSNRGQMKWRHSNGTDEKVSKSRLK